MHAEAYLRIERALEHVEETRAAIAAWADENRDHIYIRVEGMNVSAGWPQSVPPERIGILVGETVHNLRAALDYLVFRQAIADSGEEQRTQFPIDSTPHGFAGRRSTFLAGLSDEYIRLIESFQPYRGNDWIVWIRELSNLDKHRAIPLIGDVRGQRVVNVGGTDGEIAALGGVRQPDGAVHYPAAMTVTFENGAPVVEILEELAGRVREVVDAFVDLDSSRVAGGV